MDSKLLSYTNSQCSKLNVLSLTEAQNFFFLFSRRRTLSLVVRKLVDFLESGKIECAPEFESLVAEASTQRERKDSTLECV